MHKPTFAPLIAGMILIGCGGSSGETPATFPFWFPLPEAVEFDAAPEVGGRILFFEFNSSLTMTELIDEFRSALDEANTVDLLYEEARGSLVCRILVGGSDSTARVTVSISEPHLRIEFQHSPGWRDWEQVPHEPCRR